MNANHLSTKPIAIIVALDERNAIGRDGGLLTHLPNDLRHFKNRTQGHTVVMGRRTFESLPKGALPHRVNVVVTSGNRADYPGCTVVRSWEEALESHTDETQFFVIGGGQLYRTALPVADTLYLTRIHHTFTDADTFFPEIDFSQWTLTEEETHPSDEKHPYGYSFQTLRKKNAQ
ncbi:dihydrofolate reductase [Limibacterium fermenti]|uniref:dihydrofolate reductase n=1 Tax=Limibacterium fermenti TaxID=3229863 RepID=UPI000E83C086|nr:dihydrofolate reductase [Porphyromonadaceae bacterium]HBX46405.1 dihydrofolate reductase [Porphyromonadaceae bacterium]